MAAKDSPLKQFEINTISNIEIGSYNLSFTNSSFAMLNYSFGNNIIFNFNRKYAFNNSIKNAANI